MLQWELTLILSVVQIVSGGQYTRPLELKKGKAAGKGKITVSRFIFTTVWDRI